MRWQDFADAIPESDAVSVTIAVAGQDDFVIVGEKLTRDSISDRNLARPFPAKLKHRTERIIRRAGNGTAACNSCEQTN